MRIILIGLLYFFLWSSTALLAQKPNLKFQHIGKELTSSQIVSMTQDSHGFVWIGTANGLYRFDGIHFESFEASTKASDLPNPVITFLFEDSKKELWVGTDDGICRYNRAKNNFIRYSNFTASAHPSSPINQLVLGIIEDDHGTIWISSEKYGLAYLDEKKQTFISAPVNQDAKSLHAHRTTRILKDPQGAIWVGSYDKGISIFDPNTLQATNINPVGSGDRQMILSNISSMVWDANGNLWWGNKGERPFSFDQITIWRL